MYKVAVEQSDANRITPAEDDTLEKIAASDKCEPGTTWQHLALYNWGTTDPHEVNRALIELVGCKKVDAANPEKSQLDPDLGTTRTLHVPKAWPLPSALAVEKTHTLRLRRRLPPPAAVFTQVDPWFIPETENCDVGWRIEGVKTRADKLDFDVYASNYCKVTPTADGDFFKFAYASVDVPILQKRAISEAQLCSTLAGATTKVGPLTTHSACNVLPRPMSSASKPPRLAFDRNCSQRTPSS